MSRARDLADSADLNFDDGTLVIDSGNNRVGIGTASPSAILETKNATDGSTLAFQATNDNDHEIVRIGAQSDGDGYLTVHGQGASTNVKVQLHSDDVSYFTGGNVGIGTSSPFDVFHVRVGTDKNLYFTDASGETGNVATIQGINNAGSALASVGIRGTDIRFANQSSEAIRIDSSGNLLVGKTSVNYLTQGFEATPSSSFQANAMTGDSKEAVLLARLNSDGNIVEFRKDSTPVGSIGSTSSGTEVYLQGTASTAGFRLGSSKIIPYRNSADTDGTIDIGKSNVRFKDLYLSGGVYLGGTGAANYLDDYEEGTWTAQPTDQSLNNSSTTDTCTYTKIGNMVNLVVNLDNINTSGLVSADRIVIDGLPFASRTDSRFTINAVRSSSITVSNGPLIAQIFHSSSTVIQFLDTDGQDFLKVSDLTSGAADLRFSISYYTTS